MNYKLLIKIKIKHYPLPTCPELRTLGYSQLDVGINNIIMKFVAKDMLIEKVPPKKIDTGIGLLFLGNLNSCGEGLQLLHFVLFIFYFIYILNLDFSAPIWVFQTRRNILINYTIP